MQNNQFNTQNSKFKIRISFIITVYNEAESIAGVLESLAAQTRQPDEIVIVDGGSQDNTVAIIRDHAGRLPVNVIESPGCNISEGRNMAIEAASGEVIAVTDAGTRLSPDWLANLAAPFDRDPETQVVAGFFHADPYTPFEVAMGATVLPLADEIDPDSFLPSSRSIAFRTSAWQEVGGYPEWIDYCEDLIFDINLKTRFSTFAFQPDAVVAFRPRGNLRAFWKQYYQYARGDGKADLWRKRHAIRYLTYLILVPLIFLLGVTQGLLWWGLYLPGAIIYTRKPYQRLATIWARHAAEKPPTALDKLAALLWIPVIRVVGDVAKMIGYPAGWRWRMRHGSPQWRIERQDQTESS